MRGPSKQELLPAVVHRKHNDVTNLPSKTELRLLAKFLPSIKKGGSRYHNYDNNYSFASGAAVGELTDAFGLKLQQREASFSTSGLSSFFVQPDAFTAYDVDATKPIDLVALARGEEKEAPWYPPSLQRLRRRSFRVQQRRTRHSAPTLRRLLRVWAEVPGSGLRCQAAARAECSQRPRGAQAR